MKNRKISSIQTSRSRMEATVTTGGQLQLNIYGEIGEDYWNGGGITAESVGDAIRSAAPSSILLRVNSPGGDSFEGISIYNVLRATKVPIETRVDGIAASAASVIALAGDKVVMGLGAMFMVHNAWTYAQGNAEDLRQTADALDKISASAGDIYVKRTGKTWDEIKAIMDAETWLNAEEAIEAGFATSTVDDEDGETQTVSESSLNMARKFIALAKFRNVPKRLREESATDAPVTRDDVQKLLIDEFSKLRKSLKSDTETSCTCSCTSCVDGDCESCSCIEGECDSTSCGASSCMCNKGADNSNSLYRQKLELAELGV
jgi:ATP-dependent protease ClpP protease subunit